MKRTRWIGAVTMTALLIAVSGVAAVMLWVGEGMPSTEVAERKIIFLENLSHGTHDLGSACTGPETDRPRICLAPDLRAGPGKNCFTFHCTNERSGIFDRGSATYTLTIWDASGTPYSRSVSLDGSGSKTLNISFVTQEAGEGGFRVTATSVR